MLLFTAQNVCNGKFILLSLFPLAALSLLGLRFSRVLEKTAKLPGVGSNGCVGLVVAIGMDISLSSNQRGCQKLTMKLKYYACKVLTFSRK